MIAGERTIIDGLRTPDGTVVRYDPPRLAQIGLRRYLKAGDRLLSQLRIDNARPVIAAELSSPSALILERLESGLDT